MFHNCKTPAEAKTIFRKLCLLLHPDKGGSNELMILLNESYERFLKPKVKEEIYEKTQRSNSDKLFSGDPILEELIENLMDLQEEHGFASDYFISVVTFLQERKYVTKKQVEGLLGVLKNWRMRARAK